MRRTATRVLVLLGAMLLAVSLGACGGKKKKMMEDPVATALKTPGIRLISIPKQRSSLRIVVPPCSVAAVRQAATKKPPGSNEIVVPKSGLTQTVAIPPCQMQAPQASTNTVLMAPGGTGAAAAEPGKTSELVVPDNANLHTIIVPPCTMASGEKKKMPEVKSFAFPATTKKRTLTAPPCMAPPMMPKK